MVEIELADALIAPDVVVRTAHRYTDAFFVNLTTLPSGTRVILTPKDPSVDVSELAERFRNDALDDQLRKNVRDQTQDLHVALVQAALREAKPIAGRGSS